MRFLVLFAAICSLVLVHAVRIDDANDEVLYYPLVLYCFAECAVQTNINLSDLRHQMAEDRDAQNQITAVRAAFFACVDNCLRQFEAAEDDDNK